MITIEQLLESVDLDFEPRWVTKDKSGEITMFLHKPTPLNWCEEWRGRETKYDCFGRIKLTEFSDKPWQECIYEIKKKEKPVVKIEKLNLLNDSALLWGKKINELVAAVNELMGDKHPTSTPQAPHKHPTSKRSEK